MVSELTPPPPNATSADAEEAGAIYRSSLFSSRQQVHLHLQILRYITPHHISVSFTISTKGVANLWALI